MTIRLPSRYEDLDEAFRGRLRPVPQLLDIVQRAHRGMMVSGGIRFLPVFGRSGSGKSSAARELGTHLPEAAVLILPREAIDSFDSLQNTMREFAHRTPMAQLRVAVVDQYEEAVAARSEVPTRFVEWLSLLDRNHNFSSDGWVFLWLTTSVEFQAMLVQATSRNRRILLDPQFELMGPPKSEWPTIVEETFEFHNKKPLPDFGILPTDIEGHARDTDTLGATIEGIGEMLGATLPKLQDISTYQVVMIWPVTDGQRISTILRFVHAREGYKLDWNAWYRQLNDADRHQLPLAAYNRARLYFDIRLVPIAAADLHKLCLDLDNDEAELHASYLDRFASTHYFSIVSGNWDPSKYSPLRERESQRAKDARDWYARATAQPTKIGKRIARILGELGIKAQHEKDLETIHGRVRADVLATRAEGPQTQVITELKAFSPDNTMPSTIRDAVRTTLKRHAQFAGFLQRQ